jgi:hypothetical protein
MRLPMMATAEAVGLARSIVWMFAFMMIKSAVRFVLLAVLCLVLMSAD